MNDITELVKMALNGDKAAFESLYEQTKGGVWFTCIGLLKNEENAKDIMQDTYLAAFDKLDTLENHAAFKTWLNKIAANKCKNFIVAKANSAVVSNSEEILEKIPDDKFLPEEYVTDAEKRKIIMDIIEDVLSVNQYRTIILYYFDEMSVAEIAELMECHEKTVQYRLKTARLKIKEEITRYEEEKNDKLYAVAPFVLLTQLFRAQAESVSVPSMPVPTVSSAPSNALNVPSDQAAAAVKTGGKTMLNTLKAKIIAGACAAAVVGGGVTAGVLISNNAKNRTESRPTVSAPANSSASAANTTSKPAESTPSASTPTQSVPEAPSTRKDRIGNLELYIPSSFVDEQAHNRGLFRQTLENGDKVYFIRSAQADYVELNDDNDFTENDVPAILQSSILRECDMDRYYPCYEELMSFTTENEESTSVLGFPFLYRTGMMHMEHREDIADLHYAAYYGVIPFVDYDIEKAPVQWLAVCETDDPDTIQYLEELVKNVAEGAVFLD